jgi:hypothetical protein
VILRDVHIGAARVDDRTDTIRGRAFAPGFRLVAIVAGAIHDHTDPQHARAAGNRSAAVKIIAGQIDEEVDPTHGRTRAGALLSDVLIVTGEVDDDLHARTIGRCIAVEVVSTRINHAGDAGKIVCVGFRAAVDDPTRGRFRRR